MQYDPCNLETEENEMRDEVMEPPKQKTPMARPVENPRHVNGAVRSEHCTPRSKKVRKEDLEDWKVQILVEMRIWEI